MEVELWKSYFVLQCNLETDGRAWAYLNEFMCIGKNKNGYHVCLTCSIPIELVVSDGGATLTIVREEELFTGRRPAAQSILQFTLKHWRSWAALDVKRRTTGCLLIPNLGREELAEDRDQLVDLVKRALPEVRAEWHIQSLEEKLRTTPQTEKMEQQWLEKFPSQWLLLFGGILSVSSASLETSLYTRETSEFDICLHPMMGDFSSSHIQQIDLSGLHETYSAAQYLALSAELELNLSSSSLVFRVYFNGSSGRESRELQLTISSDHVKAENAEPLQYTKVDRLVLSLPNEEDNLINIIIKDEDISEELGKVFDQKTGISIRLDRFLGRR